jgi:hypothetical protein
VFTYIRPLLIEKDGCVHQNILILLPCVFVCLSTAISSIFGKSFHFPFPYFEFYILVLHMSAYALLCSEYNYEGSDNGKDHKVP